jgi:cytidyltransferase-like protein
MGVEAVRIITLGTFDLFHEGHKNLIDFCVQLGAAAGWVVVGVNADDSSALNGKVVHQSCVDRMRAVGDAMSDALDGVAFPNMCAANVDRGFGMLQDGDIVVVGSEYARGDYPAQLGTTWDELDARGISVLFRPRTPGISSTQLREAL